jgi:metallophosphoesterase superfamily enzyme
MDAQFRERAVYLPGEDALVVADLHVGRDASSQLELPLGEREDLTERLDDLLATFEPAEVVVAGDLLHAFDRVPEGVEETVDALGRTVADAGAQLVVVEGNHDPMLASMLASRGAATHDEYRLGSTVVHHGHAEPAVDDGAADNGVTDATADPATGAATDGPATAPEQAVTRYVIGHDHPTIEIEGKRHPCLLYGPETYRGADVLVLPAFNRLAPGTTVNGMWTRDFQTPLVTDADALRPMVWDESAGEVLSFPPLGELRRHL